LPSERSERASEALVNLHLRGVALTSERSERAKRLSIFMSKEEHCRAIAASERASETLVNLHFRGRALPSERNGCQSSPPRSSFDERAERAGESA
jgi:hypothetical protein